MTERTVANDRYVLSEPPIGAGGMGTVWKAYDTVLRREVAVKELRIPDGLSPEEHDALRGRAMREAQAAARLDHPGIVTIHDVVDDGGRPWIVMRLLPGGSLDMEVRADGPLSPHRAAALGVQLLDALDAAHAKGVLHRDVKPQNVMLDGEDRWMLTDFGIASVAGATRTLTGTDLVTGTLGYVAPERLSGKTPGAAADLWALGATLYFAVEGRHAFDHDDLPAMIAAVITRDPEPPNQAGPLAPVIAGLMERDPDLRLDAAAARKQLLALAEGRPVIEGPTEQFTQQAEASGRPTEKIDTPTKVLPAEALKGKGLPDGSTGLDEGAPLREPRPGEAPNLARRRRVLAALTGLLVAQNGAIGALLGIIIHSLQYGMPVWIVGALAVAFAIGEGLGAWLAPRLAQRLGLATALAGTALLMGGSFVGTGAMATSPAALVPAVVALVSFAIWHRLARSMRQRIVPAERLGRAAAVYRATGFAAILLGAAVGYNRVAIGATTLDRVLVTAGVVVIVAGLLAIPAVRGVSTRGSGPGAPTGKPTERRT